MNKRFIVTVLISVLTLAFVIGITIVVLLFSGVIKTTNLDKSIIAALASMLTAFIATVLIVLTQIIGKKEGSQLALVPNMEQIKKQVDEVFRLEQQKSELEKQRSKLEKQRQSLMWQLEAATLAKEDPRLAIVIAYQGVEVVLQRVSNQLYPIDIPEEIDNQWFSVLHNLSLLEKHIGSENLETIKQMYDLRNRIIHGEVKPDEVSEDRAAEYVQRAVNMTIIISSLGEDEPFSVSANTNAQTRERLDT